MKRILNEKSAREDEEQVTNKLGKLEKNPLMRRMETSKTGRFNSPISSDMVKELHALALRKQRDWDRKLPEYHVLMIENLLPGTKPELDYLLLGKDAYKLKNVLTVHWGRTILNQLILYSYDFNKINQL